MIEQVQENRQAQQQEVGGGGGGEQAVAAASDNLASITIPQEPSLIATSAETNNNEPTIEAGDGGRLRQAKGKVTEIVAKLSSSSSSSSSATPAVQASAAAADDDRQQNHPNKQNLEISGQCHHTVIECTTSPTQHEDGKSQQQQQQLATPDELQVQINTSGGGGGGGNNNHSPENRSESRHKPTSGAESQSNQSERPSIQPEVEALKRAGSRELLPPVNGGRHSHSHSHSHNQSVKGSPGADNQSREPNKCFSTTNNTHHNNQQPSSSRPLNSNNNISHSNYSLPLTHSKYPTVTSAAADRPPYCKRRRLSYLQSLILRRWPCLALAICIMTSLIFGMLLSALTVYLMHGVTDCSGLALAATRRSGAADLPHHHHLGAGGEPPRRAGDPFEPMLGAGGPLELSSLTSSVGELRRHYAAAVAASTGSGQAEAGTGAAAAAAGTSAKEERQQFQRLPSSLWPQHYDLFIQPFIREPFYFTGKVSILMRCTEATDRIALHTFDLELDESTLSLKRVSANNNSETTGDSTVVAIKGLSQNKQLQYSIIQLAGQLVPETEYVLSVDFRGNLNDDLAGFYKISYQRQNSTETTWIAATQFQATDARRAFPCFDEPLYKATFSIQIKHWKNMTALSNMPIIDRQDSPDGLWVTDTFSKSKRMSTYLVAYAVTNFESRSDGNISVWTRPGLIDSADYALKIAGKILRHYEQFFGIEYPLPKMDMIALPDFNAGAMENWGLITYRETAMLYDESTSSVANKQRVATVVAHELAHQWFGNLVTPKWWDDLWLNEGFASFVEYIGVDHVEPKWRMLEQFVVEEVQNVFKMDALSSSHQISIPVNNPDEISEIFDHISYSKGASIIRMMNYFLTEDVFKAGLRGYLRALRYSNAEQNDLWAHLTEASQRNSSSGSGKIDVASVMNSWTLQTGFPLVTLTRQYNSPGSGGNSAKLEQTRYQPYKSSTNSSSSSSSMGAPLAQKTSASGAGVQRWEIPITFTWKSEQNWTPTTRLWMHQNSTDAVQLSQLQVPPRDDEWMLVNVNQVGYYRVNYDQRNWKLLIDQLNEDHTQISVSNRAQILDDIFELARSGEIDYRFALDSTKYLRKERDYLPWDTVLMSFSYIDDMLQRSPIYGDWKDYIAQLTLPYYNRYKGNEWTVGASGIHGGGRQVAIGRLQQVGANVTSTTSGGMFPDKNDVLEHYNFVNAIAWACQVDEHCIRKAKSVFAEWKSSGRNDINPALRYTTYCTAIENGNKDDWDFLWRAYEKEQSASERDRIMRALGCSKEIWILSRYLEWTFNKSKHIRRQDGAYVFRMIAKNNYGRDIAFNFMREKWTTIKEFYGKSSFSLGNLIRSVATSMNTKIELQQLVAFYEQIKNDVGSGKRSFQIAIEEVESNVLWRDRNYKILEEWIQTAPSKMEPQAG